MSEEKVPLYQDCPGHKWTDKVKLTHNIETEQKCTICGVLLTEHVIAVRKKIGVPENMKGKMYKGIW